MDVNNNVRPRGTDEITQLKRRLRWINCFCFMQAVALVSITLSIIGLRQQFFRLLQLAAQLTDLIATDWKTTTGG